MYGESARKVCYVYEIMCKLHNRCKDVLKKEIDFFICIHDETFKIFTLILTGMKCIFRTSILEVMKTSATFQYLVTPFSQ